MSLPSVPAIAPLDLESLQQQVQRRLGNRVRGLRIVARDGGVVLRGHTATFHGKQLAQHAAMELVPGLVILCNEIEVV